MKSIKQISLILLVSVPKRQRNLLAVGEIGWGNTAYTFIRKYSDGEIHNSISNRR